MNEKNIESLKTHLVSLGLPSSIEGDLRSNICLQPDHFQLYNTQKMEGDNMKTIFFFERDENIYSCKYYEAWLRKEIQVPSILLNEVDVGDLQARMSKINWNIQFSNTALIHGHTEKTMNRELEDAVEAIVTELKKLTATQDGLKIADCLKIKFWSDSTLVSFIPNINLLKNLYEISQRFYFFEDEAPITLTEAYRFLSIRWREKQLNAKRKNAETTDESENGSNNAGHSNSNKLLPKKRINKRKKLKHSL